MTKGFQILLRSAALSRAMSHRSAVNQLKTAENKGIGLQQNATRTRCPVPHKLLKYMAIPAGLEPATIGLEDRTSCCVG